MSKNARYWWQRIGIITGILLVIMFSIGILLELGFIVILFLI